MGVITVSCITVATAPATPVIGVGEVVEGSEVG